MAGSRSFGRMGFGRWLLVMATAAPLACAPKAPVLPLGTGAAFPAFAAAYDEAVKDCRAVQTITASMGMSGKAGSTKLRGTIQAGFAAPAKLRLEGIPPFGKPVFILVASEGRGTLVLTRDDRVLQDAPPDRIVEALAGVPLGPEALRTIVSGCGFPDGAPSAGSLLQANGGDWAVLTFADSTGYLRRDGGVWHLAAATRGPLTVYYADFANGRPASIEIRSVTSGRTTADIHLRLSDVDVNTTLNPHAFDVDLPAHPVPLTLQELRQAGPMGGA